MADLEAEFESVIGEFGHMASELEIELLVKLLQASDGESE